MTSGLAARRIEALSEDEVYYCYVYLYYCCYIYLYYCLAARRMEALSDDEVVRMLERQLAAIFEQNEFDASHSYSLSLSSLSLYIYVYMYMQLTSMVERVLGAIFENATPPTQA